MKMAKYPTFKEYQSKPTKGIQRCDELLRKTPSDVQLLVVKLQLQCLIPNIEHASQTLQTLLSCQPPVQRAQDLTAIEEAVTELHRDTYPSPSSAGPEVAKLWENAAKSGTTEQRLDLLSLRFSRAMVDLRLVDAHQSLIQLKALLPKNRTAYMAHAALTQLLSKSNDDLQARLALMLARKAVKEDFDADKKLDCRVPGQIFACQSSTADLDSIKGRSFADSKQVFRATRPPRQQSNATPQSLDPEQSSTRQWLAAETCSLQAQLDEIIQRSPVNQHDLSVFVSSVMKAFVLAVKDLQLQNTRAVAELTFMAITAVVKLWGVKQDERHLLQAAYLAEVLLHYQPTVHEAKVILVYVYSRLGMISLASKQWDELAIKEVQLDTVGHIFMTRLSTSHPHNLKAKSASAADPQRMLTSGLTMYRRVEDRLSDVHASVLNHGQAGMIFDLYEVRQSLHKSVTKRIYSLEQRRLARLTGKALSDQFVHIHPQSVDAWLDTIDTRDFTATFGVAHGTEHVIYGEGDIRPWILFSLAADSAWCLIHAAFPAVKDTDKLLHELDHIQSRGFASESEYTAGTLSHLILQAVYEVGGGGTDTKLDVARYSNAIAELHCELLVSEKQDLPTRVSTICLYLDVLRLAAAFSRFAETKKAFTREQGLELRAVVDKTTTSLQAFCKAQTLGSNTIEKMLDLEASGLVCVHKLTGRDHLVTFTADIADSTKDAWLGPAYIKP